MSINYRELIVKSGLRMKQAGLTVETWGNISVRDPETGLVYLTPSAMKYDSILEDDVVAVKEDGTVVEGTRKPTIETGMHLAVYRNRKDVNAIIHTHPLYSMVYAAQGRNIPQFLDEAAQTLGGEVKCTAYALPGTEQLAEECARALGGNAFACLINSHGAVCVGSDMEKAFKVATVLEYSARVLYMVESTGGKPVGISEENIRAMWDFARFHYGQNK